MFRWLAARRSDGFTLIEALVALAIVAGSLASIGALIATTVRGTRALEQHLFRLDTTRAVATALPDRDQLGPGSFSGALDAHRWRIDVSPFADAGPDPRQSWVPQKVVIAVQSPAGGVLQLSTVRLRHRNGE